MPNPQPIPRCRFLVRSLMTGHTISALALFVWAASAADISGIPRIIDGDTIAVGDAKIRLEGIDRLFGLVS